MGLASSMYSGISGMRAQGEKMGVIGNNLANVNTVGYKGSRMFFEDFFYQDTPTSAGIGQVGLGVGIASIYADFKQGSFETTGEATDLAIGGNGFFAVKSKTSSESFYTRAGNFRFDEDGYLTDPNNLTLQGWRMVENATTGEFEITGTPTDIRMENFQSPPNATSSVNVIANLNSTEASKSSDAAEPYEALFNTWDGTASPPLAADRYAYQTTMKVYDEAGAAHDLTVYFDPVDAAAGATGGYKLWEYIVTCDPADDGRFFNNAGTPTRINTTAAGGLLMSGTLTFNSAGQLTDMSAFTPKNGCTNPANPAQWTLADFNNGQPVCTANFTGAQLPADPYSGSYTNSASPMNIDLNFGLKNSGAAWTNPLALASMDALNLTAYNNVPGFGAAAQLQAQASTSYESGSATLFQSQDGYGAGLLQGVSVDADGILSGRYSNGQTQALFAVTLVDFNNRWGLRRMGGNLFTETLDSGPAMTSQANQGGKGSINSNAVEQSNVDMAEEFVQMITTQRGFQANTKIITTVDTLLGEVIQLKR